MRLIHNTYLLLVVICFFQIFRVTGQETTEIEKINKKQGLSSSRITGIVQDSDGFLWIGTQDGLNRYDGFDFRIFQKTNSNISSNDITDIIIDSQNKIWIATLGGGVNIYDKEKDRFKSLKNIASNPKEIISNQANVLFEDSKGFIWIGTNKGLEKFDSKDYSHRNLTSPEITNVNITSFYETKDGMIYIGTFGKGLYVYHPELELIEKVKVGKNDLVNYIHTISGLNDDILLIGTENHGLVRLDLNANSTTAFFDNTKNSKTPKNIRSITLDSKGYLWVGSDDKGLFKIESPNSQKKTITNYKYKAESISGLSGNAIYVIAEVNDNSIWVGTAWNGINVIGNPNHSSLIYSDFIGDKPFPVLSINKIASTLFLGADGDGLNSFDSNKNIKKKVNIDAKFIQHISVKNRRYLWLGTFSNGLIQYDVKTKTSKKFVHSPNDPQSISFNDVRDVVHQGNQIWVGTWGGGLNLFDLEKNTFKRFRHGDKAFNGISSDNIVSLEKDGDSIWIATFGGGLNLFDTKTKQFKHFKFSEKEKNSISSNYVFALYKDSKNNLWIGTSGAGICRMNLNTLSIQRFSDYKYRSVTSIIEDNDNNIWFGTKKGLLKYSYDSNVFRQSGFLFGDFHLNAVFADKKGNLYFGGIDGVKKFNPRNLSLSFSPIKAFITDFKLFNKKIPVKREGILTKNIQSQKEVVLNYSDNVFTFEFAGLKYPFSNNIEYAIKLENFDENWREIGKDRTATFTNLSPGRYEFKVKAKENDDEWQKEYTSINVVVLKPLWQRWWAIGIYIFLFSLIMYLVRRSLIEKNKLKTSLELEKMMHEKDNELYNSKQQFFTNISHEIRTPVTLIISSINRLFNSDNFKDSQKIRAANTIRRNSNLLLRLVNELLDVKKLERNDIVLQPTENEIISFLKGIYSSFSDVAKDRQIQYEFKTDLSKCNLWFDKSQLEKVIFNLISNAFKFTHDGGNIQIIVEENKSQVSIQIKDDGIGLSRENQKKIFQRFFQVANQHSSKNRGFGLGLSIVKDVVKLHKGLINVKSKIKEGSTFEILLFKEENKPTSLIDQNSLEKPVDKNLVEDIKGHITKKVKREKPPILVVEDNVEIQELLKELLENSNYSVLQAFNGLEGLQMVVKHIPHLVICDIMMPEMDGTELTKKIKSNSITNHIPVIILSAKSALDDKKINFKEGADDYLTKPFDDSLLLSRIENLLKGRKLLKSKYQGIEVIDPKKVTEKSKDQEFLERIYEIFEKNLNSTSLRAVDVSSQMNMSHSALYKKIKELTGLTFIEFLRDYKLSIAKQLIQEMGYSVSEASYKVGYSDRKYFGRIFKAKFKHSPSFFLKK